MTPLLPVRRVLRTTTSLTAKHDRPAFGGSRNLPFEFVQEVEIQTGAYGAEYGSLRRHFNVITKSGGNEFRGGRVFAFFTTKGGTRN